MKKLTLAVIGILLIAANAIDSHAQDLDSERQLKRNQHRQAAQWQAGFGLGTNEWDSLAGPPSTGGEDFHRSGRSISGWVHHRLKDSRLLWGGELGVLINKSDIEGSFGSAFSDEVTTWTGYIGPSLRWLVGPQERLSLDFGIARYSVEVAESTCLTDEIGSCFTETYFDTSTSGSFFGLTGEFPMGSGGGALTLTLRSHQFDAGDALIPRASERVRFDGPATSMQIGWNQRFR